MHKRKSALVSRVTSAIIATTLATTLMPAAGIAFAADAATESIESIQQSQEVQSPDGDVASTGAAAAAATAAADRVNEDVSLPATGDSDANTTAATVPAASGQITYTTDSVDRISVDVPVMGEDSVTVGDIEYKGLNYRIDADGQTASLIGLGAGMPAATLSIPSYITSGDKTYEVTEIVGPNLRGGGIRS